MRDGEEEQVSEGSDDGPNRHVRMFVRLDDEGREILVRRVRAHLRDAGYGDANVAAVLSELFQPYFREARGKAERPEREDLLARLRERSKVQLDAEERGRIVEVLFEQMTASMPVKGARSEDRRRQQGLPRYDAGRQARAVLEDAQALANARGTTLTEWHVLHVLLRPGRGTCGTLLRGAFPDLAAAQRALEQRLDDRPNDPDAETFAMRLLRAAEDIDPSAGWTTYEGPLLSALLERIGSAQLLYWLKDEQRVDVGRLVASVLMKVAGVRRVSIDGVEEKIEDERAPRDGELGRAEREMADDAMRVDVLRGLARLVPMIPGPRGTDGRELITLMLENEGFRAKMKFTPTIENDRIVFSIRWPQQEIVEARGWTESKVENAVKAANRLWDRLRSLRREIAPQAGPSVAADVSPLEGQLRVIRRLGEKLAARRKSKIGT